MKKYVATINTPGYLPDSAEPSPTFDTMRRAWQFLEDEYTFACEEADVEPLVSAIETFHQFGISGMWGTVHTPTPGADSDHDLGLSYSVSPVED